MTGWPRQDPRTRRPHAHTRRGQAADQAWETPMNVKVKIQFASPTDEDKADLRSIAMALTKDPKSVRVVAPHADPCWLVVEFTMPTEPQYVAVDRIDAKLRFWVLNRMDSIIMFPKSEQERQRARRKAERRRARK